MRLQGKVAVITGIGSGMGLAIATRFAAEGARVVGGDWHAERLDAAIEDIRARGGSSVGAHGNIAEQATAERLIELALATYGRLDVLCNNAGVMDYMQGVGEFSNDVWRRVLSINLEGPMFTSRRAVAHMLEHGGGSIICVGPWGALLRQSRRPDDGPLVQPCARTRTTAVVPCASGASMPKTSTHPERVHQVNHLMHALSHSRG